MLETLQSILSLCAAFLAVAVCFGLIVAGILFVLRRFHHLLRFGFFLSLLTVVGVVRSDKRRGGTNETRQGQAPMCVAQRVDARASDHLPSSGSIGSISVTSSYINLVLRRPSSEVADAETVVLAGATTYGLGGWWSMGDYTWPAGDVELPVSLPRRWIGNEGSEPSFFTFLWKGDRDNDGLDDWQEVLNYGSSPHDAYSIIDEIATARNCTIPYSHAYPDGVACLFGGRSPEEVLSDGFTVYEHVLYTGRWDGTLPLPLVIGEGEVVVEFSVTCPATDDWALLVVGDRRIPLRPGFSGCLSVALPAGRWVRFAIEAGARFFSGGNFPTVTPIWSNAFVIRGDWPEVDLGESVAHLAAFTLPRLPLCLHELRSGTFHHSFGSTDGCTGEPAAEWTLLDEQRDVVLVPSGATAVDLTVSFPFWEARHARVSFQHAGYVVGPSSAEVDIHYCPKPHADQWTYYLWSYDLDSYWLRPLSPWTPADISCDCCGGVGPVCSCAVRCCDFDPDGDGLVGNFDPEPLVASPDAHNANAEWYAVVCSNVFERVATDAIEDERVYELPNGHKVRFRDNVNAHAYYFVDVVAESGIARISVAPDRESRLGSPVVVATPGETCRIPLLVGVEYSVSSSAAVSLSLPENGFAEINRLDDQNYTVRWPIHFDCIISESAQGRTGTLCVGPFDPGGEYSWYGPFSNGVELLSVAPGAVCTCFTTAGNAVTFNCDDGCACDGECHLFGSWSCEGAQFGFMKVVPCCGYTPFDDVWDAPSPPDPLVGGLSITFSNPAVVFEDTYSNSDDDVVPRRSTRTCLTISASGGVHGGSFTLSSQNLGRLATADGDMVLIPSDMTLAPGQTFSQSYVCVGLERSRAEGDVTVAGIFTEAETGRCEMPHAEITVVELFLAPNALYPLEMRRRHIFGVWETATITFMPKNISGCTWRSSVGVSVGARRENEQNVTFLATEGPATLTFSCQGVEYVVETRSFEPHGLTCLSDPLCLPGEVPVLPGQAGGVGMLLAVTVLPNTVSFEDLIVMELACLAGRRTGYFEHEYFREWGWHLRNEGAFRPCCVSNINSYTDKAALFGICPEFPGWGWSDGTITWMIPTVWRPPRGALYAGRWKRFTETRQQSIIDVSGTVQVEKFGWRALRTTMGYAGVFQAADVE